MRKFLFSVLLILAFNSLGFAQKTIEPELQNAIKQNKGEKININIILKSQIDLKELRSNLYTIKDKEVRRNLAIKELQSFAKEEQNDLLNILRAGEKSEQVSDIKCRWISNYINCNATADIIYMLSSHPDVRLIGYNEEKYLLWNEEATKVEDYKAVITENITQVNADDAWAEGYTGNGIVVAVIDTGVNYNHVDLADHLWDGGEEFPYHGYNVYDDNNNPMDYFGHGTHCAGTVCGDGTSGIQTGAAPNATLMCVKALSNSGEGSADNINAGMEWAIEHGADIMSLSLGIAMSSTSERTLLRHTCVNALEIGVVAAVANGNEGNKLWQAPVPNNVRVPGSCPPPWLHPDQADVNPGELSCVVAVGAVNADDQVASFSSIGPVTWQETEFADYAYSPGIGLIRPDVCAPGVEIVSLDCSSNNGHIAMSGTSMATPCVAGIMALMLEKNYTLTPADISRILETTGLQLSNGKNNETGSCRVDALAALNGINNGSIEFVEYTINDSELGNDNNNINPNERLVLNCTFVNNSEESYNNIKAVIRSPYSNITVEDSIANINISANETFSIEDSFTLFVEGDVDINSSFSLDALFFSNDNEMVSMTKIPIEIKGSKIVVASVTIENDNNGNGILEAGETADMGISISNIGNEIYINTNAVLSCSYDDFTVNSSEACFYTIGNESTATIYFNITASDDAFKGSDIPFELTIKDNNQYEEVIEFAYADVCNTIFELRDQYGDGWNDASLVVEYSDGTPSDTFTITDGQIKNFTRGINNNTVVTLKWVKGAWDSECSFSVKYDNNYTIYKSGDLSDGGVLYTWTSNCNTYNDVYESCEAVQNLSYSIEQNKVHLSWETPETDSDVIEYEIYRNMKRIGRTENNTFVDEEAEADMEANIYSVRAIYEDCYGLFVNTYFDDTQIHDNTINISAEIFPNPSNGNFNITCEGMTRISIYNTVGSLVFDKEVNSNSYMIDNLNKGVYLIKIESTKGAVIRKIVKI